MIALKIRSTRFIFAFQLCPVSEYLACQRRQSISPTMPVLPGRHHTWVMTVPPTLNTDCGNLLRKVVSTCPNVSNGGLAGVLFIFAIIHSFHSSGIEEEDTSSMVRSVRPDLDAQASARSHRAARACHSGPKVAQSAPASPTSSRRGSKAVGTPESP
jgi:hypothetical protein